MKKLMKIMLTAAAVLGLSLIPAGFPASEAYAAVASPANAASAADDISFEDCFRFWAEDDHVKLRGPYVYVNLIGNNNIVSIRSVEWIVVQGGVYFNKRLEESPSDKTRIIPIRPASEGPAEIYARVYFWDLNYKLHEIETEHITVYVDAAASYSSSDSGGGSDDSGGSSGGSGGSSGSASSSKSSKQAKAPAPLPAATPIVTDSGGISRFGNAIIAQPIAAYPEQDRISLLSSGTWIKTSTGYWQLNAEDAGILRNRWVLVSDALSPDPAGNASWFYFDENGHMAVGWKWIAASDGLRCYYFNQEDGKLYGALLMNGTTPDGYTVDETGAWMENGIVKTIPVS